MCTTVKGRMWWAFTPAMSFSLLFATLAHGVGQSITLANSKEWPLHDGHAVVPNFPHFSKSSQESESSHGNLFTTEKPARLGAQLPISSTAELPPTTSSPSTSSYGGNHPEIGHRLTISQPEDITSHSQTKLGDSLTGSAYPALRRLDGTDVRSYASDRIQLLRTRVKSMNPPYIHPKIDEVPGQASLAHFVAKLKRLRRWKSRLHRLKRIIGSLFPGQTEKFVALTNGSEIRTAEFISEQLKTSKFVDFIVRDKHEDWLGRFYVEIPGTQDALEALEKDFSLLDCALPGESIESFRDRMRLDVPTDLYTIEDSGNYLRGSDGQIFLNAVAQRPLLQVTTQELVQCFLFKLRKFKKGLKALLSMSQQAVRAVSNLHCTSTVHTNITPGAFLVDEQGTVFLGGLQHAVAAGEILKETITVPAGCMPPELRGASGTAQVGTFALDAWDLGMTLHQFWCGCGEPPLNKNDELNLPVYEKGNIDSTCCTPYMPDAVGDLIAAFTRKNPSDRLLPEKAVYEHPAMFITVCSGTDNEETDEDDTWEGFF